MRVLVVDDEAQLMDLMARYLDHLGYSVRACPTVQCAWEELEGAEPEFALAIVDMVMPAPGGAELARHILRTWPRMRLVATSGYTTDISPLEALAPGRVVFLQKPFTAEMLDESVRRVLA